MMEFSPSLVEDSRSFITESSEADVVFRLESRLEFRLESTVEFISPVEFRLDSMLLLKKSYLTLLPL